MKQLFDEVSVKCSKLVTNNYSTSFSLGVRFLHPTLREAIHSIYGFVRFADEIVDTFHNYNKSYLLAKFKADTYEAIEHGISLNPILNSFQQVVNEYQIDHELIDTFLHSMEMDLTEKVYDEKGLDEYILGSAEVVGLMCLKVFVGGNQEQYLKLKYSAMRLGAAFQKINFLRDLNADFNGLGRTYFPNIDVSNFDLESKKSVEADIEEDFKDGMDGIKQLPKKARFGVYMAYVYFYALFKKIQNTQPEYMLKQRIRIPNKQKYLLFVESYVKHSLNLI